MTIYETLQKDHRKVMELVDKLIALEINATEKDRENLVEQIRDELIPHARAEEAVLYNSIRDIESASNIVGHAFREHMEAETVFRSLQVTEKVHMNWVQGAKKLKQILSHHIAEEEGRIFDAAKKLFIEEEARAMAEVFNKMKPLYRAQSFAANSLDMMINMMPARLRGAFEKFGTQLPLSKAS